MSGTLIGVGVGPGDPEHLTLKALRALHRADRVFVPHGGRAERVVAAHVPSVQRLGFAMGAEDARAGKWDLAGEAIAEVVRAGGTAAFATVGDPNLYSTFTYMAQTVSALVANVAIETVPGITAMQDLAARSGTVLAEGAESLTLYPYTAGEDGLRSALEHADTVVVYKGGRHLPRMLDALGDRLDTAVYGEDLGLDREQVGPAADRDGRGPYMSTVIVPARRDGVRGGKL